MNQRFSLAGYASVFMFLWTAFALSNSGFDTSEGTGHYNLAEHIIKTGQLSSVEEIPGLVSYTASNGRIYGSHEIGNTLFLLPTAFINVLLENTLSGFVKAEYIFRIKQFILSFQAGVYSAVTATAFYSILRTGFAQRLLPSFVATLCLAFTTYFWTYSRNLFDGVLCSTLLTLSFLFLLIYKQKQQLWHLFIAFDFLGFALITRISMIVPIVASITYLFIVHRSSLAKQVKAISLALITLLPFMIWQCWYNYLRTGIFYTSPVQTATYATVNGLDGNLIIGLLGLLFSPGKSIFIYAPLLIVSILLLRKFYKEYRKEAIYVLVLSILWLLLHAKLRSWYGAWGWGPRHLITILPILFLPFAVNIEYIFKKVQLKFFAIIIASFGFFLALCSIISNWHFRAAYARDQGRESDDIFIWGFWQSQSLDMLKAGVSNILRTLTHTPIIKISKDYSEANEYASSTINIWSNSLIFAGVPSYVVVILVICLMFLMFLSLRSIVGTGKAEQKKLNIPQS